jgi:Fe-S-cluster-containing dehydrogenase component
MVRYGMLVEADRCIGCDICLKSCKDEYVDNDYPPYSLRQPNPSYGYGPDNTFGVPKTNNTITPWVSSGHLWMKVDERVWGTYPHILVRYIPKPCMHCDDPPCLKAATQDAISVRSDGIVIIDPMKSQRQAQLVGACPYKRIYYNAGQQIPQKCTFCIHRVVQDKHPRCVEACPLKILTFGDLDNPTSDVSKKIIALDARPLFPEYHTRPKVYYTGVPSDGD